MYRTDFWTLWEKARVGWFERIALKHVYYHMWNRSPVQVGCMRQVLRAGALGWPRGMGWRGRREGGSGWETYVHPWLIHVNVWQKPLQYCKVISLQLVKINGKKKRIHLFLCFVLYKHLQPGPLRDRKTVVRLWGVEMLTPIYSRVAPAHPTCMLPFLENRAFVRLHISQLPLHQGRSCCWDPPMEGSREYNVQTKEVEKWHAPPLPFSCSAGWNWRLPSPRGWWRHRKEGAPASELPALGLLHMRNQLLLGYATEIWRAMLS